MLFLAPLALLAGCATLSAPVPAQTAARVEQAATLAEQAADTYVLNAKPDVATLAKIQTARAAVHSALAALAASQAAGQPLDLTALNTALATLTSLIGGTTS